jgi:hypothetical protein
VTLYAPPAPSKDPDGLAAHFRAAGYEVTEGEAKGGGFGGRLTLPRAKLADFLEALKAKGFAVDGSSVVKAD